MKMTPPEDGGTEEVGTWRRTMEVAETHLFEPQYEISTHVSPFGYDLKFSIFLDFLHPNPTFGTQILDLAGGSLYPNPIAPEISGGLGRKNGRNTRFWAELHRFYAFPVIWGWFEIFDFFDFLAPESQFWWMGNVPLPNWKKPGIFQFWSENSRKFSMIFNSPIFFTIFSEF